MKNSKSVCKIGLFILAIIVVVVIGAVLFYNDTTPSTGNAKKLLEILYSVDSDQLSGTSADLQETVDLYKKKYGSYMTKDGFEDAIKNRTFKRITDKINSLNCNVIKKVQIQKRDIVKDWKGKKLYRYNYVIICNSSESPNQEVSFEGELNLVKSENQWLVEQLEPNKAK